jgi:hypothetical protein
MRYAFLCLIVAACSTVYGGEEASVLVQSEPTPVVAAPAPVVVTATPAPTVVSSSCNGNCCNGKCHTAAPAATTSHARVRTRYRVVNEGCDACTGKPVRSVSRGVVRGTGAVVQGVGGVALDVITLPARVCRNGRCN